MNSIANNIKQRLSLREPLCEALDVVVRLTDKLTLKKYPNQSDDEGYKEFLKKELEAVREICPLCRDFERDFPSFAFSIATGVGKTRLMGALIAYLYLKKGVRHFFVLAPNLTLYEKLIRDFGDPSYEKYVFKGLSEFVNNRPVVVTGDNYEKNHSGLFSDTEIEINIFNIAKFNSDSKEEGNRGIPRMKRLSEYLGQSYFDYLASLPDLVVLMDEAHRYHADASKKAINELRPILGLEMTATPTDEKGKSFNNIVYEYNLAQALADGKYVKIPMVASRRNFQKGTMSDEELDALKMEDAISIHEQTKVHLELYAKNNNKPVVKPFILVVCRNIQHAKDTLEMIEERLFNGKYKGKVLQIDSSTKKSEEIERLFVSLEQPDNQIEIVIHVNMLKEGWDVTNLYTIVPLRAADAPILVEQSIGRGLRLPYGGKRTGYPDVDKLTVIAHENFSAVIEKAQDPNSVLNKLSYVELDDEDFKKEPCRVSKAETRIDLLEKKSIDAAKTEIEKKNVQQTSDAIRSVWNVIPQVNTLVKSKAELTKPEIVKTIRDLAIRDIEASTYKINPIFAEELAEPIIYEVDNVINAVLIDFVKNIIEIPRMIVQKEVSISEFQWFDLDTSIGFDLPALNEEIIRISVGAGERETEVIQVKQGRTYDSPLQQIMNVLIDYDEINYDENSELLYHLAQQAIDAVSINLKEGDDIARVVSSFKRAIAKNIYDQMMRHFVVTSKGYSKPNVLPFVGMVDQNLYEVEGYGRKDYRDIIPPAYIRKFIFTGFMKSYYTECKFDSKTEQDFANVLETDPIVLHWLRPASSQFFIYWANGANKYEPDFIVETDVCIYMVETKAAKDLSNDDVAAKKRAAEEYCKHASEYTSKNGGKPWSYVLLAHDTIDRTSSLEYLLGLRH